MFVWLIFVAAAEKSNCTQLPRVPATSSAEAVAAALKVHGAVVIEGAATAADMARLSADLKADNRGTFFGSSGAFATADTTRNPGKPLGESAVARALAVHPLVVAAANEILSPFCRRVVLGTCSFITVHAPKSGVPDHPQTLHRDDSMWAASDWTSGVQYSVSVMWAVTDFTRANGATRLALGTHTDRRPPPDDLQQAEMKAGDVLLWLGGTHHGAGASTPGAPSREGLLFIYNLGWLRTEHNFHNAMPLDVIRRFDDDLKNLMGYFGDNAQDHPWFTGPVYSQPYLGGADGSASGDGVQFQVNRVL